MASAEDGKTIHLGDIVLKISDPLNIQPVSCDILVEQRVFAGIVCLSFAAIFTDGIGKPEARVTSRMRLTLAGATDLRNILDVLLKAEMPSKKKAN